jgi:hypothetical protein
MQFSPDFGSESYEGTKRGIARLLPQLLLATFSLVATAAKPEEVEGERVAAEQ